MLNDSPLLLLCCSSIFPIPCTFFVVIIIFLFSLNLIISLLAFLQFNVNCLPVYSECIFMLLFILFCMFFFVSFFFIHFSILFWFFCIYIPQFLTDRFTHDFVFTFYVLFCFFFLLKFSIKLKKSHSKIENKQNS